MHSQPVNARKLVIGSHGQQLNNSVTDLAGRGRWSQVLGWIVGLGSARCVSSRQARRQTCSSGRRRMEARMATAGAVLYLYRIVSSRRILPCDQNQNSSTLNLGRKEEQNLVCSNTISYASRTSQTHTQQEWETRFYVVLQLPTFTWFCNCLHPRQLINIPDPIFWCC